MNFGYLTPSKNMLPRVKDYPNRVIKTLEKEDRDYVTQGGMVVYGRNEVRKYKSLERSIIIKEFRVHNKLFTLFDPRMQLLREDNLPYANKGKFREKEKTNNDKVRSCQRLSTIFFSKKKRSIALIFF